MNNLAPLPANLQAEMEKIGAKARAASSVLAQSNADARTKFLKQAAERIRESTDKILRANTIDMEKNAGKLSPAMQDRLNLTAARVEGIAAGLEAIAAQPDPIDKVLEKFTRPNGLEISRISVPLGVIGMIYESRPNVTAEAAAIALRGGNAIILRGGSDCIESSKAIAAALQQALADAGLPKDAIQLVGTTDRAAVGVMLQLSQYIDVIVPRGGKDLIERVERESKIPLLRQYEGICHVYLHAKADAKKAVALAHNSKLRRVSICGSAECLVIDRAVLQSVGKQVVIDLLDAGCEIRGDSDVQKLDSRVIRANDADFGKEFLSTIMAAKVVDGLDEAITFINQHSSHHTDSIVTEDAAVATAFSEKIESAIVMVNASTQFADGGEFGFGGEIGIATGRLHARGPIGAAQLTSYKYVVRGNGQIRP